MPGSESSFVHKKIVIENGIAVMSHHSKVFFGITIKIPPKLKIGQSIISG